MTKRSGKIPHFDGYDLSEANELLSAPNMWIANKLDMGVPASVTRHVSKFIAQNKDDLGFYNELITKIKTPFPT